MFSVPSSAREIAPILIGEKVSGECRLFIGGERITLADVLSGKPHVLVFYRGGW